MMEIAPEPPAAVPPMIGHVDASIARMETGRYSFEESRADAVVSPMEDIELGRIGHPQHGNDGRAHDSGMYARLSTSLAV